MLHQPDVCHVPAPPGQESYRRERNSTVQPLDELMREVLKRERLYAVQGNEWYGWWVGRLPDGRQVFVAWGGRAVYYPRWHQLMHPELPDPNAGSPTLYLAVFDAAGDLQEVLQRPDPLRIDTKATGRDGKFDVAELEVYLSREFGGFERATIQVRPFVIPEIGVELNPLHSMQVDFLDDPDDYTEDDQETIREWIEAGCSELLYGNDYLLGGSGEVDSS